MLNFLFVAELFSKWAFALAGILLVVFAWVTYRYLFSRRKGVSSGSGRS